jgi:hypothetical protein
MRLRVRVSFPAYLLSLTTNDNNGACPNPLAFGSESGFQMKAHIGKDEGTKVGGEESPPLSMKRYIIHLYFV